MGIQDFLVETLQQNTRVWAMAANRIYPLQAPQKVATPFIVYQIISTPVADCLDGYSGLDAPSIQIDSYAKTNKEAYELSAAVFSALDNVTGTVDGLRVQGSMCSNKGTHEVETDPKLYRIMQEYIFWIEG